MPFIGGKFLRAVRGVVRKVQGDSASTPAKRKRSRPMMLHPALWVRITGAAAIAGAQNRWTYTGVEVVIRASDGTWIDKPDGATISGIYNGCEAGNNGTGIESNGIDLSHLPPGFAMVPIRGQSATLAPVGRIWPVGVQQNDGTYTMGWAFSLPNEIDGQCA